MPVLSNLFLFFFACSSVDHEAVCRAASAPDAPRSCAAWVAAGPRDVDSLTDAAVSFRVWEARFRGVDDGDVLGELLWELAHVARTEAVLEDTPAAWNESAEAYHAALGEFPTLVRDADVQRVVDTLARADRLDELELPSLPMRGLLVSTSSSVGRVH